MKHNNILKRMFSFVTAAAMSLGLATAITTLQPLTAQAAYISQYPDRIIDDLVFDDIEGYLEGEKAINLGMAWWYIGNNQNNFAIVAAQDGQQAMSYTGVNGYSTFVTPNRTPIQGNIWIDVDIKLPADYNDFRMQFGGGDGVTTTSYGDRVTLIFYKAATELKAMYVQDPAGGTSNITLSNSVPQEEWFTISVCIDTENETFKVYMNGEQLGREMTCYHKFDYVKNGTEKTLPAAFNTLGFANRESANGGANATFYLDNFRIAYGREIETIENMEVIVDKGESYTFPDVLKLMCDDGNTREFPVIWTADGADLDTNTVGTYYYTGTVENYPDSINLMIYVKEREISEINTVFASAFKYSEYFLPEKIDAVMDDGKTKKVSVISWRDADGNIVTEAPTDEIGISKYYATVDGYALEVELILSVTAYEVRKVEDVYDSVELGGTYTLPTKVRAVLADNSVIEVDVEFWNGDASLVDTSVKNAEYHFTGRVDGYDKTINLTVTVYEPDGDLEYFMTVLEEFYNNCITVGRDRTYIDPSFTNNPLFALGIDSSTGQFALWQGTSGDYPLSAIATQGPLMKALEGMTLMTEDDKYFTAVEEAYDYILENHVDPDSHLLYWGDHCVQNMYTENYDHFDTDEYGEAHVHQLEQDYPNFDLMFRLNPEVTATYVEAMWRGHFNDSDGTVALDTLEFTRHANMDNPWALDDLHTMFSQRHPKLDPYFPSGKLTYLNAAADYIYGAVKMWENLGDEDALYWGLRLLEMYHKAAHPITGVVPFQYTDTTPSSMEVKDVYDDFYLIFLPLMRMEHSFPQYIGKINQFGERVWINDYATLMQGSSGGGNYIYPLICFAVADCLEGDMKDEVNSWGLSAIEGFAKYIYNYQTGKGNNGLIDGTNMTDAKTPKHSYYQVAGRTAWPLNVNADMGRLLLMGYERSGSEELWKCLQSICMSYGVGDIGTAPGENVELEIYTESDQHYIMMVLARLYEMTKNEQYYTVAKRMARNLVNNRYRNGYFYAASNYKNARLAAPEGYALLYFVAAAEGRSKSLPQYMGESSDFTLSWKDATTGKITKLYGNKLFNQTIEHETLPTSVETDITEAVLKVGEKIKVNATVSPSSAEDKTISWFSDNKKCAIVNKDGTITALAPGKAIISAEAFSGVYTEITIIVE